jgi:hypothetical protein
MVTYNSAGDLPGGLAAVGALAPSPSELVIVDCASTDASVAEARRSAPASIPTTLEPLADNRGFAGGMNRAVALSTAPYLLTLNADARPAPGFLAPLVARLEEPRFARVAAVTGRLVRELPPASAGTPAPLPQLDACGMRLSWTWRHFDRGSGEPDGGQYAAAERVFGATGAATSCGARRSTTSPSPAGFRRALSSSRRRRARLPFARARLGDPLRAGGGATHRRRCPNAGRAAAAVNLHSSRTATCCASTTRPRRISCDLPATLTRDLAALAWVLLRERTSLPAYAWLWQRRRELARHRRLVQQRRTVPARAIGRWFLRSAEPL